MAKKGFNLADFSSVRGPLRNSGWVLCVGAGTSGPLFPDWGQLVLSLIAADPVVTNTSRTFASLRDTKGFSLDALIQAAQDRLALSDDAFADRLSTRLYSKLPADPVRARMLRCLAAVAPGELPKSKWQEFIKDVTSPSLSYIPSAVALSDIVARSRGTVMAPKAILSFNAEPLLYALINAQYAVKNNKPVATPTTGVPEPQVLTPITRSISNRRVDRIPYYFCHGLLRVGGINHGLLENGSPEKLVFSESTYLSLANESFSWQAATFISLAQAHSLIFVGMSLTD